MTTATYLIPANIKTPQGELQNTKYWMLNANPSSLVEGLFWFDSVNHKPKYYDGTSVQEYGRIYTQGTGITISSANEISVASTVMLKTSLSIDTGSTQYLSYNSSTGKISIAVSSSMGSITEREDELVNGIAVYDYIQNELNNYILSATKGAANGVASLGSDGKVPSSQLPAYVDDVVELLTMGSAPSTCATGDKYYNTTSKKIFTATGTNTWGTTGADPTSDVIYVRTDTNGSYRWAGSDMINIANPIGAATESAAGIAEIATNSETSTGTDDTRIVTPLKLATYYQKKLTQSTGITIDSSNNISVTNYAALLKNNAYGQGTENLAIGEGSSIVGTTTHDNFAIGYGAKILAASGSGTTNRSTAIGNNCVVQARSSILIGSTSTVNGLTLSTDNTFAVGYHNTTSHENTVYSMLDFTTGLIPDARISSSAKKLKYAANNTALTASGGVATWEITHGLGTDDVMLVVKDISTGEIIFPAWKITSGKVTIEFLTSANIAADTYRAIIMG